MVAQANQEPSPPKYDLRAETKMKATVDEVRLPPRGNEKEVAPPGRKERNRLFRRVLCSKSFFDVMGMSFGKGDEVTLTGSKVKHGEADLILARKVVRGNDTFVLGDEKGNPF
jgi:hypothetical protein